MSCFFGVLVHYKAGIVGLVLGAAKCSVDDLIINDGMGIKQLGLEL